MTSEEVDVLVERRAEVQARFSTLLEDGRFQQAISVATGDAMKVRRRFGAVEELFREVAG